MVDNKTNTEEGKFFIGAVKFFDVKKDFGFIASNNCNISSPKYNQDFYVDSSSFLEEDAKKEGRIVVFKIHKQSDGKKRAIQVRGITKSEEDIQLALSYYGDHEYITYNDNRKINLYTKIYKPVKLVAEKVQRIIENDTERSPKKTLEHFTFFINHYKKEDSSENKYIFDRDFSKDEKTIWIALFSSFTEDESIELLKSFPSAARYFKDNELLQKWIEIFLSEDCSLSNLKAIAKTFNFIPDECVKFAKVKMESIVERGIKAILAKLSTRSDISYEDLFTVRGLRHRMLSLNNDEATNLLVDLHSYRELTTKEYKEEIQECLSAVRNNNFKNRVKSFKSNPSPTYCIETFPKYIKTLSEEEINLYKKDIEEAVSYVLDNFIDKKQYGDAISLINEIPILDNSFVYNYKKTLYPLITDYLSACIVNYLDSPYSFERDFLSLYDRLTMIFDKDNREQIIQNLLPVIKEKPSLNSLSAISSDKYQWISIEEAISYAENIISSWQFNTYKDFVESDPCFFDNDLRFIEVLVKKVVQLIGNISLKYFFDGTPVENESERSYYSRNPERENCTFLNNLKQLIPEEEKCSEWENYINTRNAEDLIILFENQVINTLPERIIIELINTISLDYIYGDSKHWYEKPYFKNPTCLKIFETYKSDLTPLIGQRLSSIEWNCDNIPLAVFLTELMTANKPSKEDYYALRNWESSFKSNLEKLASTQSQNRQLTVVLWAVHFQTKTSMATFSDMFAYLPPYTQIRCVKKLFQLIAQEKIKHTVESLYKLVGSGTRKICFPLEVTFAYLKLRETDSNATLNNNVMLQLLEGRDDHMDWVGIRQMMTQCIGRVTAYELNWKRNSYFNGVIKKISNNVLRLFAPYKMIDEYGNEKDYNNKYFHHIIDQIKITYTENEYDIKTVPQGVCYDFDISYEVELFSIARAYNFIYNGFNNFIGFETKEEQDEVFCECRLSNNIDNCNRISFYWCGNKPCYRVPVRYKLPHEWECYTILDFMRILRIPTDYTNKAGNKTKYGHYIILSSYLKSFAKFYEHLSCRECGKLMKPKEITNFTTRAVTEFSCANERCQGFGKIIYLNHCFNKQKCNATIDSRDSKTCPNGQYICPECGACCSTENFKLRIQHLYTTGGYISERLVKFVEYDLGHWEKHIYFCYKCGKQINESCECPDCGVKYK